MAEEGEPTAYDRGVLAGEINARLAGHDKHFAAINGSLTKVGLELEGQRLLLQRLADQADAAARTAITTAAALKDADEARRNSAEQKWTPWQRRIAVITVVVALLGVAIAGVVLLLSQMN
jgi:hypothetical protein